jgi:hypothetical protein
MDRSSRIFGLPRVQLPPIQNRAWRLHLDALRKCPRKDLESRTLDAIVSKPAQGHSRVTMNPRWWPRRRRRSRELRRGVLNSSHAMRVDKSGRCTTSSLHQAMDSLDTSCAGRPSRPSQGGCLLRPSSFCRCATRDCGSSTQTAENSILNIALSCSPGSTQYGRNRRNVPGERERGDAPVTVCAPRPDQTINA